jgi:hypothetical protein
MFLMLRFEYVADTDRTEGSPTVIVQLLRGVICTFRQSIVSYKGEYPACSIAQGCRTMLHPSPPWLP